MTTESADFGRALALATERSTAAEEKRRLDDDVIAALAAAGVSRALLPTELGGRQAHPNELIAAVARTATADASTGWCLSVSAGCKVFSGYMPEAAARDMYIDPDVEIACMFAPLGVATRSAGPAGCDANLTGRWPFMSNCLHSRWIGLGFLVRDGDRVESRPRVVFLPSADLEIEDTWYSSGLQATGSHHVRAETTPIAVGRSFTLSDRPWADGPLWRMPLFTVLGPVQVAAPLGIARSAIDAVFDSISYATTGAMRGHLADDPVGLAELAAADAALRAAHAGVLSAVDDVWTIAEGGQRASRPVQARVMLASLHAIDSCVEAVSVAHRLCGGGASYSGHHLLTALHDVHAARQHVAFAHQHRSRLCRIAAGIDE